MALVSAKTATALLPALLIAGAFACSSFGSDDATDGDAGDGGSGGLDVASEAQPSGDAPDSGCRLLVEDSFDDVDASAARWRLLGAAKLSGGEVELVPDVGGQTGALWMNLTGPDLPPGRLRARFTSKIAPPNGSDGLTFAWSANKDVGLGGTGGNYGLCGGGAEGLAVVLSSFDKEVRVLDVSDDCAADDGGTPTNVFGTNVLEVSAAAARVDVSIADKPFAFAVRRSVRVRSIGFTAATGGGHARHAIDDVRVELCPE